MPITDPQYNVQPLGREEDTRYFHHLLHLQEVHRQLLVEHGWETGPATVEAHRAMVDSRLEALERSRKLNAGT